MKTKKIKVLFLFAHLNKAGMQRAVSNISRSLPENIEQHVGYFGTDNPPFEYRASMHNFNLPGARKSGFMAKLKNFVYRSFKLRRFVRDNQIDLVVSFGEASNLINMMSLHSAGRILGVRVAIGVYDQDSVYNFIYRSVIRWAYPRADAIVACSEDLKSKTENIIGNQTPVYRIPNMYHLDEITKLSSEPLSDELAHFTESPFILNVGTIQPRKGQQLLIRAFHSISKEFSDLRLLLIGDGPDVGQCQDLIKKLDLSERVKIISFDPNPYKYMHKAKLFALTSFAEGFPNVLVEAMACGCPVLAYDCPTGPREILGNSEHGELLEQLTVDSLVARIKLLFSSPERLAYLSKQATKRAQDFDVNQVVSQWDDVLRKHA